MIFVVRRTWTARRVIRIVGVIRIIGVSRWHLPVTESPSFPGIVPSKLKARFQWHAMS